MLTLETTETTVHPAGDIDAELAQLLPEKTGPTSYCTQWSASNPSRCCC